MSVAFNQHIICAGINLCWNHVTVRLRLTLNRKHVLVYVSCCHPMQYCVSVRQIILYMCVVHAKKLSWNGSILDHKWDSYRSLLKKATFTQ